MTMRTESQYRGRPVACNWNELSPTASNTCTVCEEGKECPSDNHDQVSCDGSAHGDRFRSETGETQCFKNQMTYYSATLDYTSTPIVNVISPKYYGQDGMSTSSFASGYSCPPAHQCLFPMMQHWARCPPGTYSQAGTDTDGFYSCQPCPEGSYCTLRQDDSFSVPDGFFSPFNAHMHFPVPAGFKGSSTQKLRPCKPGERSSDLSATCTPC